MNPYQTAPLGPMVFYERGVINHKLYFNTFLCRMVVDYYCFILKPFILNSVDLFQLIHREQSDLDPYYLHAS